MRGDLLVDRRALVEQGLDPRADVAEQQRPADAEPDPLDGVGEADPQEKTTRCPTSSSRVPGSRTAPPPSASTPSCSASAAATAARSSVAAEDGIPVVGVPKTIDNDLAATDFTFGFQTAVQIATDAIDRLHTTAESHNRVLVCEVMGRHAGWLAVYSGMAGGADVILIPERPFDIDEVVDHLKNRHARGATFSIVVVAEGATPKDGGLLTAYETKDAFGHVRLGGIGMMLERQIEEKTGFESRTTILGHIQRGGTPLAFDRVLGTRFGVAAVDAITEGNYGKMTALRGTGIELVPLAEALAEPKLVDSELYETAEVFFG